MVPPSYPLQAEVTVSELVRVVGKAMLLHLPQLVKQPSFSALWVAVLNCLAAAAAAGPEGLNDAAAAALQNLIIMLHEMVSSLVQPVLLRLASTISLFTWLTNAQVACTCQQCMQSMIL